MFNVWELIYMECLEHGHEIFLLIQLNEHSPWEAKTHSYIILLAKKFGGSSLFIIMPLFSNCKLSLSPIT